MGGRCAGVVLADRLGEPPARHLPRPAKALRHAALRCSDASLGQPDSACRHRSPRDGARALPVQSLHVLSPQHAARCRAGGRSDRDVPLRPVQVHSHDDAEDRSEQSGQSPRLPRCALDAAAESGRLVFLSLNRRCAAVNRQRPAATRSARHDAHARTACPPPRGCTIGTVTRSIACTATHCGMRT